VHPKTGAKKFHNGTDAWKAGNPYLEACFDGKVVNVITKNDNASGGNQVVVQSTVMGKKVTWIYMHRVHGSIKVKKGQRIEAGTVVGRMGETGFATGPHVHAEIWMGHRTAQPNINNGGKGFYDPMKFIAAAIEWEEVNAEGPLAAPADAPVAPMPPHSVAPVAVSEPAAAPFKDVKVGSKGANVKSVQKAVGVTADGVFGPITEKAVKVWQKKVGLPITGIIDSVAWLKIVGK